MTRFIEDRLARLEAANRVLVREARIARALVILLFAALAIGMTWPQGQDPKHIKAKSLEVEEIIVRDERGIPRMMLIGGMEAEGGNATTFIMANAEGNPRAMLKATVGKDTDAAVFHLVDDKGDPRASVGYDPSVASITVGDCTMKQALLSLLESKTFGQTESRSGIV